MRLICFLGCFAELVVFSVLLLGGGGSVLGLLLVVCGGFLCYCRLCWCF